MANSRLQLIALVLNILAYGCLRAEVTAPQGEQGPKGVPGPTGAPGVDGPKGATGALGDPGLPGIPGLPGADGVTGAPGFTGIAGPTGEMGVEGVTGYQGQVGVGGVTGAAGAAGGVGQPGVPGVPGFPGPKGLQGDRGDVGIQGPPGVVGGKGEKGAVGGQGSFGGTGNKGAVGPQGFSLREIDVDECASSFTNDCSPISTRCVNLATGYKCTCKVGFEAINSSKISCKDIEECTTHNGGCAGSCVNTVGSYICTCPGETKITANKQCKDNNECVNGVCGGDSNMYCVNKYGGYSCVSSQPKQDEVTTVKAPIAQALTLAMVTDTWIVILLIWFGVITFISIIILIWLIHVFYSMKKDRDLRRAVASGNLYDINGGYDVSDEEEDVTAEGMAASGAIHIDIPRLPRSNKGTVKSKGVIGSVKGNRSYKSASRSSKPASLSSSTGSDLKTASVRHHRMATGERNSANRLSGVDTFY